MDWHPSPLEPNLKFASELKEDLKTKYFAQHERAKKALENFSCSLQTAFLDHQRLLNENVELSITIEKLIANQESNKKIAAIVDPPISQILGASPNCKLKLLSKLSISDKKNNSDDKSSSIVQKENINDFVPIYSEDFSDIDDTCFMTHKSPPVSVVNSPVKIQSSPILSKRKKKSSKNSNSSVNTSSQSIDSNCSKVSSANASSFEKNIDIDLDLGKDFDKEYYKEPLKPIENILQSSLQNSPDKSVAYKILNVSKTNYAKTEFLDKGKKSMQTVLSFKKVAPVMDISKVDLNESFGNNSINLLKKGNSWSETFYNNSSANQSSDNILVNMKKFNSPRNDPKECRTLNKQNTVEKQDDIVEISPIQNKKSSKLRNKFSSNKKLDINDNKKRSNQLSNEKLSFSTSNNMSQQKYSFKNETPDIKCDNSISLLANIPQRSVSDETYFSQAELTNYKNDMTNFEVDLTGFEEDDMQCDTPPAKKMLLDSFDIIPGREEESPGYAYKEGPVRKKSDREKLPGWGCRDCEAYYANIPEKDRKNRQNKCSKHRGTHNPINPETPPSFWNPVFSESEGDSSIYNN